MAEQTIREPIFPHEVAEAYVRERLGGRMKLFDELADQHTFSNVLLGLVDQLSIYADMVPQSRLRLAGVRFRAGKRSFVLVDLLDRGGPLRLRDATERWGFDVTDRPQDFVDVNNARRWRFLYRYLGSLIDPMFSQVANYMVAHRARTYANLQKAQPLSVGLIRYLEDVHVTSWCCELDPLPEIPGVPESRSRYFVQ